jgi:tryptophan halogenase
MNIGSFVAGKSHLVQSAVFRLITLFPQSLEMHWQQQEFNRLTHLELDHIGDFHRLHYYLCNTQASDFWRQAKKAVLSDRLDYKLKAFKQRGVIPFYEGETFDSAIWTSLLVGAGYWPERHDPMVLNIDDQWIEQQLLKMKSLITQAANAMPDMDEFLEKFAEKQKIQA